MPRRCQPFYEAMSAPLAAALASLALVVGCAGGEDRTWRSGTEVQIDSSFDAVTQEATVAAVEQWQQATHGATGLSVSIGDVVDARASIFPDARYSVYGRTWMSVELPPRINLDIPAITRDAPGNVGRATLLVALHEVGHALGLVHTEAGIMADSGLEQPPCLDLHAVSLLCEQIGCPDGFEATCEEPLP